MILISKIKIKNGIFMIIAQIPLPTFPTRPIPEPILSD